MILVDDAAFSQVTALLLRRLTSSRGFTDTATALCCIVKQLGSQLRYGHNQLSNSFALQPLVKTKQHNSPTEIS